MATPPPFAYNLLELYRQHRDEIETLTDPVALFLLAFVNEMGHVPLDELAGDAGLTPAELRAKMTLLTRGQLLREDAGSAVVTALGKRLLEEIGFVGLPPAPPREPPKPSEPPPSKPIPPKPAPVPTTPGWLWGAIAFLSTGAVILIGILVVGIIYITSQSPTPTPFIMPTPFIAAPTVAPTWTPTASQTPTLAPAPTWTPTASRTSTSTPTSTPTPSPTPAGRITGAVMRAADQKAIPGARIQISSGQVVTSLDGSYGFSGLASGTYSVTASATGYNAQTQSVTVRSDGTTRLDFQLTKAITAKGEATLRPWDCFNLDSPGEYFAAPSNPEFFTCPTRADIQWLSKEIRLLNGAAVAPAASPYTYEGCQQAALPGGGFAPVLNKYYCVYTSNNQTALVRFTKIDSANRITFYWWLY